MTIRKPSLVGGVEVLLQVVDDDAAGLGIVGEHAEVEGVVVVEHPHFGVEGRGLALARIVLNEAARDRRLAPGGSVERAVERHEAGGANSLKPPIRVAPFRSRLQCSGSNSRPAAGTAPVPAHRHHQKPRTRQQARSNG